MRDREHDDGLYGETDKRFVEDTVVRELTKAFIMFGQYTEEFWEQERLDWEASQLDGAVGVSPSSATQAESGSVEPVELAPWEISPNSPQSGDVVIDVTMNGEIGGQLGWESNSAAEGSGTGHSVGVDSVATSVPANGSIPSLPTETTKEKQQTIRLDGTVGSELNYHFNHKNEPRVVFTLHEDDQIHTVYTTKAERVEPIRALSLLPGDAVHIAGVEHQLTRMVDGELETRPAVYVWGLKKKEPANQ